MGDPKLQIIPKKYNGSSIVISMRIPRDMLNDIDNIASETGRTRNELLYTALEFALDHMEVIEDK